MAFKQKINRYPRGRRERRPRRLHHELRHYLLHLPKTAGTTLSTIVVRQFPGREIYHVRDPEFTAAPVYSRHCGTEEDLLALPESQRAGFTCVLGHMRFGLHRHLAGPCTYLAMLRDPVERLLSQHAQFNRMARRGEVRGQKPMSLEAFCRAQPQWLHNPQTRYLSEVDIEAPMSRETQAETLERVQSDLREHFCVVGTTDRFDETMLILKRRLGWRDMVYVSKNISRKRDALDRIEPDMLERIERNSWIDRQVYEFAHTLLDEAIESYGPPFEADLRAYRQDLVTEAARYKRTRWKRALGRVLRQLGLTRAGPPGATHSRPDP